MPNREMLNEMEFENKIKDWQPAEQFLARQIYAARADLNELPCKREDSCPAQAAAGARWKYAAVGGGGVGTLGLLVWVIRDFVVPLFTRH